RGAVDGQLCFGPAMVSWLSFAKIASSRLAGDWRCAGGLDFVFRSFGSLGHGLLLPLPFRQFESGRQLREQMSYHLIRQTGGQCSWFAHPSCMLVAGGHFRATVSRKNVGNRS